MTTKTEIFNQIQLKKKLPDIRPGDTVRIHQKIKEKNKEMVQVFEGLVLARKHGKGISATITVRRVISGIGVEKIFPLHSPVIKKIEIVKKSKVRRAKLYYLRKAKGKKARLKRKEFSEVIAQEPEKPKKETETEKKIEKTEQAKKEKKEKSEEKPKEKDSEKKAD